MPSPCRGWRRRRWLPSPLDGSRPPPPAEVNFTALSRTRSRRSRIMTRSPNPACSGDPISAPQRRWRFAGSALLTDLKERRLGGLGDGEPPGHSIRGQPRGCGAPPARPKAGGPRVVSSSTTARHPSAAWILPGDVDMVGGKPRVRRQPPRIARSAKRFVDHRPEDVALTPS
jgi:hypothetical protein